MAITIHISSISPESKEFIDQLNLQIEDSYGEATKQFCVSEGVEEDDLWDCYYFYSNLTFDDVDWDFLSLTGEENEVYCLVYDHENKVRRGFWYDEDAEWIELETGALDEYEAIVD